MPGLFLIQANNELVEMQEAAYDSENVLQELIARYPNLLAGDQISSDSPRRWLLIKREMTVPCELQGSGRWSMDHLFLDQDAIPTLIEVKRSTDTRIRREVVGQMLDYAANAVAYWPVEAFRSQFDNQCELDLVDADHKLTEFLADSMSVEDFWQRAKTNLQAGKIRMVFVADQIPPELRRIIEFLNEQLDPAEVLGVEIKQYLGGQGLRTLVPRVVGQTAEAEKKKSVSIERRNWDEHSFYQDCENRNSPEVVTAIRALHQTVSGKASYINYGVGKKDGNIIPRFDDNRGKQQFINFSSGGGVGITLQGHQTEPFSDEATRLELLRRLNEVPGVQIKDTPCPSFKLKEVVQQQGVPQLLEVINWAIQRICRTRAESEIA